MKQMIFAVPEAFEVAALAEDEQVAFYSLGLQWPELQVIGSAAYGGKRIVLVLTATAPEVIEQAIFDFAMDIQLLAVEGEPVDWTLLEPFFPEVQVYDASGNPVTIGGGDPVLDSSGNPVLDGSGNPVLTEGVPVTAPKITGVEQLQRYAGHEWL